MDTYRFQIDIANVTQNTLDKLNAGTPTASDAQNSLNLLLGTEEGYSHSQNPITLIHWSLKNHHTNTVYIDREGVELGQNYWAGSGPAWKFAYKTLKPTYKPNLMVNTYIPKGRVFTGFDSGADGAFTLPHKGEYALKFTVKGEAGYGYTAALLRKTKGKGVLTQAYDDFIATGEKQVITVPFYGEDLDDTYTFQLNGGALYPNTTNGRGDEKLLVYGVQLVTDAVAKIGEVTYPDLDWALKDAAASGETVTLLTEVEYTRSNVLSVPAGVTLDLAGYNLKAKNLVSFGQVIDGNVGGKGSLTLVDRQGQATQDAVADLQVNNTFMPLYDSANQCYRFYDYEIVNAGCKPTGKANEIKYGYKLRFYDVSAFELLAKGDTGVVVVADVHWDDCGFEYRHTISAATLKSYAENVKTKLQNTPMDSIGTAMALTVSKVNHIGAGNSIYSTPTVFSELTGVSGTGTESSYTYNKA